MVEINQVVRQGHAAKALLRMFIRLRVEPT
jgi:hypothetical protein